MNTSNIKSYAPKARNAFIAAMSKQAAKYGITESDIAPMEIKGDLALIGERPFPKGIASAREALVKTVEQQGFIQTIEKVAYSWFNRLCAIRYMELKGFLDHGRRVLSHPEQESGFQILDDCLDIELPGLNQAKVQELKLAGDKDEELYRELLLAQCHALHKAMPFLFESIDDQSELLLPENLTNTDSLIREMVTAIPKEDWKDVEIIGWLYQFYISEKKDQVIGKVVKSEDIPAATQLFTPNWIVKYLVQNSVGRQWLQAYPDSPLKAGMEYYIEPTVQTQEVQNQLAEITPDQIDPLTIKVLDPAAGSGHILVEAYTLLKTIYEERGYRSRDIPQLILENNLFGLDIDDRAAQLAGFALIMLAREDDRRIFTRDLKLNVLSIQESKHIDLERNWQDLEIDDKDAHALLQKIWFKFEQGKTFGSLIEVPNEDEGQLKVLLDQLAELEMSGEFLQRPAAQALKPIIHQAWVLSQRYDAVLANPPYLAAKSFTKELKTWLKTTYQGVDKDLFSAFMVGNLNLTAPKGHCGVMTSFVWMFISTFERLREKILTTATIESLIQLHYDGFAEAKAHIMTYVCAKNTIKSYEGGYIRLADLPGVDNQAPMTLHAIKNRDCGWFYSCSQEVFEKFPMKPIAYWAPSNIQKCFEGGDRLGDLLPVKKGMDTGNNDIFLKMWHEVDFSKVGLGFHSSESFNNESKKWLPYDKGGYFRKWYGNNEWLLNWEDNGCQLRSSTANLRSESLYFQKSITWCALTSTSTSARLSDYGSVFDSAGSSMFPQEGCFEKYLAIINSSAVDNILKILNPTLNYGAGSISNIPVRKNGDWGLVKDKVNELIRIFRLDWSSVETSFEFEQLPLLLDLQPENLIEHTVLRCKTQDRETVKTAQDLELGVDEDVIRLYGLENDIVPSNLTPSLLCNPEFQYRPSREADYESLEISRIIKSVISFSIGCMMGRYSLDRIGLVYAHSGNKGFTELVAEGAYKTFPADDDGIVPLTDMEWFSDDATNRFLEFVKTVWSENTFSDNLDFVATSLCLHAIKPQKGDDSLDTIRRYLSTQFSKDHLKTYKKRPIYWLFSSGKEKAFECLVYLHRYNEGTLARMRTEYVIPLTAKLSTHVSKLEGDVEASTSTAEIKKLEKEIAQLHKQQAELSTFDEKLRHYADQRISLDLDDGVKVNYGKFGDLLAEVKAITGKNPE